MDNKNFDSSLLYIISDKKVNSRLITKRTKIGRGGLFQKVDIKLNKNFVENIQGSFDYDENGWTYTDLGGNTNSMVNGDILGPNNSVYLSNGDHILIAGNKLEEDDDFIFIVFSTNLENEFTPWKIMYEQEIASDPILSLTKVGYHLDTDTLYAVRFPSYALYMSKKSEKQENLNDDHKNVLDINIIRRTVRIGNKKRDLLKDIKLSVRSGEMVLVLGGSGAGKSTFLNAVSAYEKADASISYNNRDLYQDLDTVRRIARLVPQYNTLRPDDIVQNTLEDIVKLQLVTSKSKQKDLLDEKVLKALQTFGLTAEAKNQVSKLSGGQQKRLSIAVEYISDPMIFYLDEPDSGLDASSAKEVMKNLRAIADEGKIVILISHSPDRVIQFFDKVLVLAKDSVENCGRLAYYGPTKDTLEFFGVDTLEDVVKLINTKEEGGHGKADYYIKKFENINGGGI